MVVLVPVVTNLEVEHEYTPSSGLSYYAHSGKVLTNEGVLVHVIFPGEAVADIVSRRDPTVKSDVPIHALVVYESEYRSEAESLPS